MKISATTQAAIGLVLVALAGPGGFLLYRSVLGNHPGIRVASATVNAPAGGLQADSAPAASPAPAATPPDHLPDLALPDTAGVLHKLSDYRGRPLLLNFWASWCEPCRREIPLLQALHRRHGDSTQVIGVAMDFKADAMKFAQARGVDYPLLMGEKGGLAAATAVGVPELVLPFTVIADSRGDIVTVKRGELHQDEADLILSNLAALDAGRQNLATTRLRLSDGLRDLAVIRAKATAKTRQ